MARRLSLLAGILLSVAGQLSAQGQNAGALRQAIARTGGRAIIVLKSSIPGARMMAPGSGPLSDAELSSVESRLERQHPLKIRGHAPIVGAVFATVADSDVAKLLADGNVASIEPDVLVPLSSVPDVSHVTATSSTTIPWGISTVGAPASWLLGLNGTGIKVGMIDTGIDITHPDLVVAGGFDFTTNTGIAANYNDNVGSCFGHGTHTAGTVGARGVGGNVTGVAPAANLYALKVFADYGSGCSSFVSSEIQAIQWAVTNHLDVVSISIANPASMVYAQAVSSAVASGLVIVAAAGNGNGAAIVYPAAAPGAIAVAALNSDWSTAGFSNIGPEMWVAAPGVSVESTIPGGYGLMSGTSMATPHVTGVVALLKQSHPTWTPDQIRTELKNTAIDINLPGFDNNTGWGLVRAPTTSGVSVPLAMTVSPLSRSASVVQGAVAPGDNATITITGTGNTLAAWTVTKRKSWTTLITPSGTGSGTITWSRSATGLAAGTYVDTLTIAAVGVPTAATIIDTLKVTPTGSAPPQTAFVALSPTSRKTTVAQGGAASSDAASVIMTGTDAWAITWTAFKQKAWTTITKGTGQGNSWFGWSRNPAGLAPGTYVDTISISAPATGGPPALFIDTLVVTGTATPIALAVSPASRNVSVQQGGAAPSDNAMVTLTGTNASSAAWTATKLKSWTTLTTASGTGTGTVGWSRNAAGLAVGTYVDTITVTAAGATGSPTRIIDTLRVTAAPVPLVLAVSPISRKITTQQNTAAAGDNATVTLSGDNSATTAWTAAKKKSWTTLTTANGTGSGTVAWSRSAAGLAAGTYVDTITVTAAGATGSPSQIIDSMVVTAAPVPLVLAVSPASRNASVQVGSAAPSDNGTVTLTGDNASTTAWSASKKKSWTTLTTAAGSGSGTVAWSRNASGLGAGTYVDTITVSAIGAGSSPAQIIDTLTVTAVAAPPPPAPTYFISVWPTSRSTSLAQNSAGTADAASVVMSGADAWAITFSATKQKPWTTITKGTGQGNSWIGWSRNPAGLLPGVYVDTISVIAAGAGGSPARIIDTLIITGAAGQLGLTVSPSSRNVSAQQGAAVAGDNATVTLTGNNAGATAWTASKKKAWTTLVAGAGTGTGTVSWTRSTAGLAVGTYVDTITVTVAGANGSPASVIDTLRITAVPVPLVLAVSPTGRKTSVTQGGAAASDNATVTLSGDNASTTAWSATKKKSWTSLVTANGTGSGTLSWSRNAAGLAAGTYVDTITVTAAGANGSPATVIDTLQVNAVVTPVSIAVSPASRTTSVQAGAAAAGDNASVTVAGTNASSTAWNATKKKSWTTLTNASGTGSGTVSWTRSTSGLAAGTYVDTITITASAIGSPAQVIDTMVVTAVVVTPPPPPPPPPAVTIGVWPSSRNTAVQVSGSSTDAASVFMNGPDAWAYTWTVTKKKSWTTITAVTGHGNGWFGWSRNAAGLAIGTYVDTISVQANNGGPPALLIDTLRVTSQAAGFTLSIARGGEGSAAGMVPDAGTGIATVLLNGSNSASTSWTATTRQSWITLTNEHGTGSGAVTWTRNTTGLGAGTWVDTITVSAGRLSAVIVDSVVIGVLDVSLPQPADAVHELFKAGSISADQRARLDREGNNNGKYDLGDFLAWVQRAHIKMTAEMTRELNGGGRRP